jgi:hypothetical protein
MVQDGGWTRSQGEEGRSGSVRGAIGRWLGWTMACGQVEERHSEPSRSASAWGRRVGGCLCSFIILAARTFEVTKPRRTPTGLNHWLSGPARTPPRRDYFVTPDHTMSQASRAACSNLVRVSRHLTIIFKLWHGTNMHLQRLQLWCMQTQLGYSIPQHILDRGYCRRYDVDQSFITTCELGDSNRGPCQPRRAQQSCCSFGHTSRMTTGVGL